jgi:hypothetical protein
LPSTHASLDEQATAAHGVSQVNVVKSGLGLHSWLGRQLPGLQGSSTHAPPLQTLPQPTHGVLKQLLGTHLPALTP